MFPMSMYAEKGEHGPHESFLDISMSSNFGLPEGDNPVLREFTTKIIEWKRVAKFYLSFLPLKGIILPSHDVIVNGYY